MPRRPRGQGPEAAPARAFVDSSAWIAFFSARDTRHGEADAMFRRAATDRVRLLTTNLVLAEVHRLLLFRAGIRPAASALDKIDASRLVTVEFADQACHRAARKWLDDLGDQVISYADAVSFAVMKKARCGVAISFDRDFMIAGFQLLQP